ncbi:MAG: FAD-dependent oxidoreductase [Candidatus Eisenbacteria bacterium]
MTPEAGRTRAMGSPAVPDLSPPCRAACPLDKDVPGFLRAIASKDTVRAWRIALRDNLFPGVLGWICPRPCESVCRRSQMEAPVAICSLKKWVGSEEGNGKHKPPRFIPDGPKVAIIGAGPAGLAAAHDLTVLGADVTLYDEREQAGGLLTSCIPDFRLPRDVAESDVDRILSMGLTFRPGVRFGGLDDARALLDEGFAAVVLAIGGGVDLVPPFFGWHESPQLVTAIDFLSRPADGRALGHTLVVGGGNAALDVARAATRRGATDVEIVYRRRGSDMRALPREIDEAREEGIRFRFTTVVDEIVAENGTVVGVRIARTDSSETGFLPADTIVSAIGQSSSFTWDASPVPTESSRDSAAATASGSASDAPGTDPAADVTAGGPAHVPGADRREQMLSMRASESETCLFVCGDFETGPSTVADAIASGRRAAARVTAVLEASGVWESPEERLTRLLGDPLFDPWTGRSVDARAAAASSRAAAASSRAAAVGSHTEDVHAVAGSQVRRDYATWVGSCGADALAAASESASLCLSCDQTLRLHADRCVLCGQCAARCPEDSLRWIQNPRTRGFTLSVDDTTCIRCGECVAACPVGAIHWTRWTSPNRNVIQPEPMLV